MSPMELSEVCARAAANARREAEASRSAGWNESAADWDRIAIEWSALADQLHQQAIAAGEGGPL